MIRPLLGGLAIVLALGTGCLYQSSANEPYIEERNERTFQELKKRDPETGVVVREWTAFLEPGERSVTHGEEIIRYPSGALHWKRSYDFGEPDGEWTSWYEDGTKRSHVVFAGPGSPAEMTFWHPNGRLSMQGPAVDGVREGAWTIWHENGVVAARGRFESSLRTGQWTFWDEAGELSEAAEFESRRRTLKVDE